MHKTYYVYILANKPGGLLYVGVTNNLKLRIEQHKTRIVSGFTKQYNIHTLVYYEMTENIISAITREKELKNWHRSWKIRLIKTGNPNWNDLSKEF